MVAVRHSYDEPEQPGAAPPAPEADDLGRLSIGLSKSLLASTPEFIRELAARAEESSAAAARRAALVGERPVLDDAAAAEVDAAVAAYEDACRRRRSVLDESQRALAVGNSAGVGTLIMGGVMVALGLDVMAAPVAVLVVGAGAGPAAAAAVVANRCSRASIEVSAARARWSGALGAAGVPTMGALAARRVAVAAWRRRREEAGAAHEAAQRHHRAWARVAGPGVAPAEVESLVHRLELVRQAQMRALLALLSELHSLQQTAPPSDESVTSSPPPPPALAIVADVPVPPPTEAAPTWLEDALARLRGRRLRLWRGT